MFASTVSHDKRALRRSRFCLPVSAVEPIPSTLAATACNPTAVGRVVRPPLQASSSLTKRPIRRGNLSYATTLGRGFAIVRGADGKTLPHQCRVEGFKRSRILQRVALRRQLSLSCVMLVDSGLPDRVRGIDFPQADAGLGREQPRPEVLIIW